VVLDSAIHLYLPGRPRSAMVTAVPFTLPEPTLRRTFTQSTAEHLLNSNYLSDHLIRLI